MINLVITLKWTLLVITLTRANADDTHGIERRATNADSTKKIVCYYTNWSVYRPGTAKFSPQNINPYLCTHLIYAFGGLDKENGLRPYDKYQDIEQGGYAKFTGLKTYNKNLKTMLAIGGWNEGSSKFSALVADDERRGIFVKNVIKFLRQNNFDGLDLDWEYPAFRDGSKPDDKENYASLVKELREEFERESSKTGRSRLLLTMAVPAGIEYIDKGYDVPKLNKYLDFMNILSYDYHSAYEPNVNHHSPLYSLQEESEYNFDAQLTIDYTVNHYLKKGVDREKLVLGIPTYGRSYTLFNADSTELGSPADGPGEQGEATREKGYLAYYEICANLDNDKQWKVVQPKKSAMGPYAYRGNQWVSYDDADIVKLKAKYVNEKGLGGIMYWSIDNDDFRGKCHGKPYPLIEAGKESLLANSGSSANVISTTSDEKRSSKLANKRNRPKSQNLSSISTTTKQPATTSATSTFNPLSTPEPPTTPDPGTDFVCKEEGFFPHPRDCKKYFWCLDSGPSNLGIVAHQFTCPSGLMFNKAADSCDYSRNVICNKKSEKSSATTTAKSTSAVSSTTSKAAAKITAKITTSTTTTTTTTTSTTESSAPAADEDYEDVDSQEDPKAIKQLIALIKKLGGIDELEKQLKIEDGSAEVTTPAISKTLYNKVFSSPSSTRYKNQYRNGPSSPQHETVSSNDDVPYYRKEKPQYVTIQRSRPLKNVAQDTEDSGTTNNKSVQPGKYQETVDYADDETQVETTTNKYSSPPRHRTSIGADSRGGALKYVTLERNRSDRTTTTEEELKPESPITTQRYITLVRQRPSPVTEYEEINTEPSPQTQTQRTSSQPKSSTDSPITEKLKEKVSETEMTATNLPVTSAQYNTDQVQLQTLTTLENLENVENIDTATVTAIPKTYLVFSKTIADADASDKSDHTQTTAIAESQRRDDVFVDATTITATSATVVATTDYVTETFVPSTSTTVITTIRESPTEKTRISLKRYKEYLKNNKTDLLYELRSNNIFAENPKQIGVREEALKSDSTTKKWSTVSRKRPNYTPATIDAPNKAHHSESGLHSRFFLRRNKNISSTATATATAAASTEGNSAAIVTTWPPPSSLGESASSIKENGNDDGEKYKSPRTEKPRYRFKYRSTTAPQPQPESDSIGSFFAKRRLTTRVEQPASTSESTIATATTKASGGYFSRNRKTSASYRTATEPATRSTGTTDQTVTQSEILDSDENRYELPKTSTSNYATTATAATTAAATNDDDDSLAIASVFDATSKTASATKTDNNGSGFASSTESSDPTDLVTSTTTTTTATATATAIPTPSDRVRPKDASTAISRPAKNETEVREPFKAFRNNSRFLKNPEPEYARAGGATTTAKNSTDEKKVHRFGTPIRVVQVLRDNQIEHAYRDDAHPQAAQAPTPSRRKTIPSNRASQKDQHDDDSSAIEARRGRKKFLDSANEAANAATIVVENNTSIATAKAAVAENSKNNARSRSRFRQTLTAEFSTRTDAKVGATATTSAYAPARRARPESSAAAVETAAGAGANSFSTGYRGRFGSVGSTITSDTTNADQNQLGERLRPDPAPTVISVWTDARENDDLQASIVGAKTTANPSASVLLESLEKEFRQRSRPAVTAISTDTNENESQGRPRFYHLSNRTVEISTAGRRIPSDEQLDSGRRSKWQRFNVSDATRGNRDGGKTPTIAATAATVAESDNVATALVTRKRNRGNIKAQNSLSKTEIRELESLVNPRPVIKTKKQPRPIVEEIFMTNVDGFERDIDSDSGSASASGYAANTAIPEFLERSFEETTDTVYVLDGNSIANVEMNDRDVDDNQNLKNTAEIIGASETKYANGQLATVATVGSDEQRIKKLSVSGNDQTINADQSEPSSRYRENFRRTSSPRSRSRSTTSTTTTENAVPNESGKLANRFRRRKIKPENRSISSSRNENSYSFTHPAETSTTRPKNIDISQRGSTTISDFLPVPAPLYSGNATSNNLDIPYNVDGVNLEDLEAQTLNTRTNYYNTEDVSDLANPAVVAIHNLKTVPPASQQVTYSKTISSSAPQIAYTEEISLRPFPRIKATPTPTILPSSNSRSSIRRGTVRLSLKTTTTTQLPPLQDIYNDYHETDVEYHADPVEIPITGKVRIHSDGYIECLDMGNFPHPFSCKKFISCAKMEYDSLLGWEYTCPKGLSFDPIGGICNWAAGLGCKE